MGLFNDDLPNRFVVARLALTKSLIAALCLVQINDSAGRDWDECLCDELQEEFVFSEDLATRDSNCKVGGWIAQGFTWNPASPQDGFNGPITVNDRSNAYQLNQLYCFIERSFGGRDEKTPIVFRGDLVFGTDAFLFQAVGLDDNIISDSISEFYKLAFPQFYFEVPLPFRPDGSIKLGKWFSPLGFEYGLAAKDFFYSHPLAFNMNPFTHAGILLESPVNDHVTIELGIHRGMDVWQGDSSTWGYVGAVHWSSKDGKTSATLVAGKGPERDSVEYMPDSGGILHPVILDRLYELMIVGGWIERHLTDRLTYLFNFDVMQLEDKQRDQEAFADAYAFTQSVFYQWSARVTIGARLEILRDNDGKFIYGFRSQSPPAAATYANLTLGLNLQLRERARLRPELRWDWQDRDDPTDAPAFRDANSRRQFLFATDLVVTF